MQPSDWLPLTSSPSSSSLSISSSSPPVLLPLSPDSLHHHSTPPASKPWDGDENDVTLWRTNRQGRGAWPERRELRAERCSEYWGVRRDDREVEEGGGGLVRAQERRRWVNRGGGGGRRKLSLVKGGSTCAVMDKYRPKRPTSLNLLPQLPQAGTQVGVDGERGIRSDQGWIHPTSGQ